MARNGRAFSFLASIEKLRNIMSIWRLIRLSRIKAYFRRNIMLELNANRRTRVHIIKKDFMNNWQLYLIFLPVLIYYLIFSYVPMTGILISFQRFNVRAGILGSQWIGLENFKTFIDSYYFGKIIFTFFICLFLIYKTYFRIKS